VRLALTGTGDAQLARLTRLHRPRVLALARLLAEVTGSDISDGDGDVQAL
jgi:hypothetical protein